MAKYKWEISDIEARWFIESLDSSIYLLEQMKINNPEIYKKTKGEYKLSMYTALKLRLEWFRKFWKNNRKIFTEEEIKEIKEKLNNDK